MSNLAIKPGTNQCQTNFYQNMQTNVKPGANH